MKECLTRMRLDDLRLLVLVEEATHLDIELKAQK